MRRPLPTLVLALLLLPSASATWYAAGSQEPDAPHDSLLHMFPDPPQERGARVYFNAFASPDQLVLNPNVATLGSRLMPAGAVRMLALLGVWVDCNRDAHVGLAEGALQEYRSEALLDASLCPVGSAHNDGAWVTELRPMGMVDPCEFKPDAYREEHCKGGALPGQPLPAFHRNPVVVYLNGSAVWGDWGLPGEAPPFACPLPPWPRGTTSSGAGLLGVADCQAGRAASRAREAADPDGALGVADGPLPASLFGEPGGRAGLLQSGSGEPAFRAWDCDRRKATDVADPTRPSGHERGQLSEVALTDPSGGQLTGPRTFPVLGKTTFFEDHDGDASTPGRRAVALADDEGSYAWAPAPAPALGDPVSSSLWDGAAHAADGPRGDCDPSTGTPLDDAYAGALVESDVAVASGGARSRTDFAMTFFDGYRGFNRATDPYTGASTPTDFGLPYTRTQYGGALWIATEPVQRDPQVMRRDALEPEGRAHATFYAAVPGASALGYQLPSEAQSVYGAEACPFIGTGAATTAWACDPALWWRDGAGGDATPRYAEGQRIGRLPGDAYHLRDVDCWDGALARGVPLHAGGQALSSQPPCPDAT